MLKQKTHPNKTLPRAAKDKPMRISFYAPRDIYDFIESRAAAENRSLNNALMTLLREVMEKAADGASKS